MSQLDISDKFVDACSPVIDTNFATCGTITKASIDHLSVTDLNALFTTGGLYHDMDAWFFHSIEMKACGTKVFAWYDWIMANSDRSLFGPAYKDAVRPGTRAVKGPGLLQPWIMGRQESVVNRDHWKIEDGIDAAGYAAGGTVGQAIGDMSDGPLDDKVGSEHTVTAILRISSRHGIPVDINWFRAGEILHVFTLSGGVAQQGSWKVVTGTTSGVTAAVDTALTYIDVLVTGVENSALSTEPFHDYAVDTSNAAGDDVTGVMVPGINNVNDFESWCTNLPNVDPRKMVPFWYQTYRQARCVDSEYLAVFKRLMQSNEAFRQFGDLDLAERNRQDEAESQKRFVNAFFFQKPISTNQTLVLWESLDAINTVTEVGLTPGLGGKIQARRANWVGVKEQLRNCSRVFDLANSPLNLLEFFQENYNIMRARKSQGRSVESIDWFTNAFFREKIYDGMLAYYKDKYTDQARFVINMGEVANGFMYDTYKVAFPAGLKINIISDEFFDDWYTEHDVLSQPSVGNLLLALDIGKPGPQGGSIYYAQLAANRKSYSTAKIDELARLDATFRCVMETISIQQTLTSETGTVVVECPKNSAWIQNISMDTPIITGKTTPYGNLY